MDHRAGRQHLGVEPRATCQQPMENAAVPVRPIHHRRATKFPSIISHLVISVGPVLKARHLCTLISLSFLVPNTCGQIIWPVPAGALLQFYYIASMRVCPCGSGPRPEVLRRAPAPALTRWRRLSGMHPPASGIEESRSRFMLLCRLPQRLEWRDCFRRDERRSRLPRRQALSLKSRRPDR